jgi:hypothetical protein
LYISANRDGNTGGVYVIETATDLDIVANDRVGYRNYIVAISVTKFHRFDCIK